MKIGVYGGTFNPIHSGHLNLLKEFYERLGLEKIILIPTYNPPHKSTVQLASPVDRLNMCALAVKELNFFTEISTIEIDRKKKSYTADTLRLLKQKYPKDSFYLLMGEDMFLTVDKWYLPEIIFKNAIICAAVRSKDGINKMREYAQNVRKAYRDFNFILEDIPFIDVSSTQVRQGKSKLLPLSVQEYIEKEGLYFYAKA